MNAAFLLMSSAALAGADPAPAAAAPAPAAPVVISSGNGCSNCGTPVHYSDCGGCSKPGLLDRIKARFSKKSHDCGCAPACAPAPVPCPAPCAAPAPCNSCPKSIADRPNLFDKLKSKWGAKKSHGPCCDTCGASHLGGGCAAALPADAAPVVPGTGTPPKEMPKPKDPLPKPMEKDPKDKGKGGNPTSAPLVPTVNGAGLTTPSSPY